MKLLNPDEFHVEVPQGAEPITERDLTHWLRGWTTDLRGLRYDLHDNPEDSTLPQRAADLFFRAQALWVISVKFGYPEGRVSQEFRRAFPWLSRLLLPGEFDLAHDFGSCDLRVLHDEQHRQFIQAAVDTARQGRTLAADTPRQVHMIRVRSEVTELHQYPVALGPEGEFGELWRAVDRAQRSGAR